MRNDERAEEPALHVGACSLCTRQKAKDVSRSVEGRWSFLLAFVDLFVRRSFGFPCESCLPFFTYYRLLPITKPVYSGKARNSRRVRHTNSRLALAPRPATRCPKDYKKEK